MGKKEKKRGHSRRRDFEGSRRPGTGRVTEISTRKCSGSRRRRQEEVTGVVTHRSNLGENGQARQQMGLIVTGEAGLGMGPQ